MAHIIDEKEQPMSNFGTTQGPNKRYRRLRHPAFTADTWTSANPLLQKGEIGIETDTYKMKAGDGVTYWNDLPYTFDDVGANIDLSNLSATGKANVSAQGTYNEANTYSAGTVGKALQGKLNLDGTNTMTGVLKMRASVSFQCAIAPYWDGVGFYKLNDNDSVTLMASIESTQGFLPAGTNVYNIGSSDHKWKDLYLAGKAYIATINNGGDIAVPTTSGTLGLNDFSNITDSAKNIANWSNNVTNCITEIPQDIQLELSSGTLTLKAGSKCYLKTDTTTPSVNIASDLTTTQTTNGTYFAIYNGSALTTVLTITYDYSSLPSTYSLPLAVITVSGGAITSIDQVFNGFGYIGNTVFVLPGVKGLIPYYGNSDGSLKNSAPVSSSVNVYTITSVVNNHKYTLAFNGTLVPFYNNLVYNEQENRNYAGGSPTAWADIGYIYFSGGKISQFFVKKPFHAVDYSDGEYIANQAMPGTKYIDLTFSHGMATTAPADGYFVLAGYVSGATLSNNGGMVNATTGVGCTNVPTNISGANSRWTLPVRKGDTVQMYLYDGTATVCRFVFANGIK